MTKLRSIQALRGIAALAVYLCHLFAIEEGQAERAEKLTDFWVHGTYGVDLFFVISGFIMVWVAADMRQGARSGAAFLYSRATRIYPLWWLFAGAMALFLLIFRGVPWDANRLTPAGLDGPTHLLKSFILWPQSEHPVLGVGWTLVHEMYFYIGFAALILLIPARWRMLGLAAWGSAVLVGALSGLSSKFASTITELVFYPMTLQFIAGAFAGYAIKAGWRQFAIACTFLGAIALIAVFLQLDRDLIDWLQNSWGISLTELETPWRRTVLYGLPCAVLIYGVVALELERGFGRRVPDFMVALGDWSYSLYLCHVLTISFFGRIIYTAMSPESAVASMIYLTTITGATILVAALTYYLFERPSIIFFKRWRPDRESDRRDRSSEQI